MSTTKSPVVERIDGKSHVEPCPALRQVIATSALGGLLVGAFQLGVGGPGGWIILDRPVIHLGDDIIIPDLVGYRVERAPRPQDEAFVTIVPDWVCEYLGPKRDTSVRVAKMLAYARAGVPHSWILDPLDQTLDVLKLSAERQWLMMDVFDERTGRTRVCAEPFNAIEFDLAILWHSVPPRPTSRGVST